MKPIQFRTDENGRFRIDGVPAGKVTVVFNYHLTADMITAWTKEAQVEANQNTEVRIFTDATEGK